MAMNLRNPIQLLRGLPSQIRDSNAAEGTLYYDRAHGALVTKSASGFKYSPVLADTIGTGMTIYVDANAGNDDNDGLSKGSAVRTLDKALFLATLLINYERPVINVGEGTYKFSSNTIPSCYLIGTGKDKTVINGTMHYVENRELDIVDCTLNFSGSPISSTMPILNSRVYIEDVKIIANADGEYFLYGADSSFVYIKNSDFDVTNRTFLGIVASSLGSAVQFGENINFIGNCTVSIGSVIAYANSIVDVEQSATFTGVGITGPRYFADRGSIIYSGGNGAYIFPGTSDGILQTGATYY